MSRLCNKKGFTIIELTLAMTFLSVLLVMITMMVIRVGDIYNRGLTIKDVNQAGRVIIRDLQQTISQSRSFSVDVDADDNGLNYVKRDFGGRLCTGQYSYIWNYAERITDNTTPTIGNANLDKSIPDGKMMRFIRVPDSTAQYCSSPTSQIDTSSVQDLLGVDDLTLALYDFSISRSAFDSKTGQGLYYISFTVGTDSAAAVDKESCTPDSNLDTSYCSINQFNMVVRAGNEIQY